MGDPMPGVIGQQPKKTSSRIPNFIPTAKVPSRRLGIEL